MQIKHSPQLVHEGDASFLLVNTTGDYYTQGYPNKSQFQGYFIKSGETYFKILETFRITEDVDTINLTDNKLEVQHKFCHEKYRFYKEGIIYTNSAFKPHDVRIELDCREIYDYSASGRIFNVEQHGEELIVEYIKYKTEKLAQLEYKIYLVFNGIISIDLQKKWIEKKYSYDFKRDIKSDFFIFHLGNAKTAGSVGISASTDLKTAKANASFLRVNSGILIKKKKDEADEQRETSSNIALKHAKNSLESLTLISKNQPAIYAGLPWFFQIWTRDELISLGAYIVQEKMSLCKDIIMRHIREVQPDGRIPNRYPPSTLGTADGIGWLGKRTLDILNKAESSKTIAKLFKQEELEQAYLALSHSIDNQFQNYGGKGELKNLIVNRPLETWMDTGHENDVRQGARIEIQALTLATLEAVVMLGKLLKKTDTKRFQKLLVDMQNTVRQKYFDGKILYDGIESKKKDGKNQVLADMTARPNIFIAHYTYPQLLHNEEWKTVFDASLQKLFLDWGGLSSIDKDSRLYCPHHTGINNRSYHRGDSWYWINNLAGLCLSRLDHHYYKGIIQKIVSASEHDILFQGYIGHHSELSNAASQEPAGCFCQAWSSAMFIELMEEIGEK
ncbi:hypothetical protein JW868_01540 [Candidatus Woesearchaeota archaeon]|nr:hypothetical protein [Candidatus Woesearchaeota archaeon]